MLFVAIVYWINCIIKINKFAKAVEKTKAKNHMYVMYNFFLKKRVLWYSNRLWYQVTYFVDVNKTTFSLLDSDQYGFIMIMVVTNNFIK